MSALQDSIDAASREFADVLGYTSAADAEAARVGELCEMEALRI